MKDKPIKAFISIDEVYKVIQRLNNDLFQQLTPMEKIENKKRIAEYHFDFNRVMPESFFLVLESDGMGFEIKWCGETIFASEYGHPIEQAGFRKELLQKMKSLFLRMGEIKWKAL